MDGKIISHPIADELLMGYAAGLLPEAYDLMVATAVSLDDDARARLEGYETMGGALLGEVEVVPLREDSFDAVMARIAGEGFDSTVHGTVKTPRIDAVLPQPLREALGGDVDVLRWRNVGMGVRQIVIDGAEDGPKARLLSIPAGQAMPDHGHNGSEITLVLKGAFHDGDARYARGDVEIADDMVEHQPVADIGGECICFVVTDAPLRFNQLIPRIAQRFMDI
jgi:putative transcriptional regulator